MAAPAAAWLNLFIYTVFMSAERNKALF